MNSFVYDNDIENHQQNTNRFSLIEDSLNRTLISNKDTQNITSLHNKYNCYTLFIYILAGLLIIVIIIGVIFIMKNI